MKLLKEKYSNKLIEFLKENRDLILNNDFELLYKKWVEYDNYTLTTILMNAGIDPLPYISKIPDYFMWDKLINNIIIPDSITEIGPYAFDGCDNLKNITLPKSLEQIGPYAFPGTVKLIYEGSKEEWERIDGSIDYNNYNIKYLNK